MLTVLELLFWGSIIMFIASLFLPPNLVSFGIISKRRTVMLFWLLLFCASFAAFKFMKNHAKADMPPGNTGMAKSASSTFNTGNSSFYIARLNPDDNILEVASAAGNKTSPAKANKVGSGLNLADDKATAVSQVNASKPVGDNSRGSATQKDATFSVNSTKKQKDKSLKESAVETAKEVGGKIKETGREAKETGQEFFNDFMEGVSKFANDAKDTGKELLNSAKNATK